MMNSFSNYIFLMLQIYDKKPEFIHCMLLSMLQTDFISICSLFTTNLFLKVISIKDDVMILSSKKSLNKSIIFAIQ